MFALRTVARAVKRHVYCHNSGFALANYQANGSSVAKPGCSPVAKNDFAPEHQPGFVSQPANYDSAVDFDYSPVVSHDSVSGPRRAGRNCFGCQRRNPDAVDFPSYPPVRGLAGRPVRHAKVVRLKLSTRAPGPGELASG